MTVKLLDLGVEKETQGYGLDNLFNSSQSIGHLDQHEDHTYHVGPMSILMYSVYPSS